MSSSRTLLALAQQYLYPNYNPAPVVFVRGEGSSLYDVEGKRWLDLCAGIAVCAVGHGHPVLAKAIAGQAAQLIHVSNGVYNRPNILLAQELCTRTGMARAFFCNSGTEATEALLKCARRYFYNAGQKDRTRIVAFHNAFHGRTMGALSMTGNPKYHEGFPQLPGVTHVHYGDLDAVRAVMGPDVAAILAEPIQAEGGVIPAPPGFLEGLRALCDETGALFLVDEVQTGMGRTGTLLAIQKTGAQPDAISLAKGLAGGVPIGAMLTTERLAGALPPGSHGSTFGGNPLASAAALAVLGILDSEQLVDRARAQGVWLGAHLTELVQRYPQVCEQARGAGLLWGLVLKPWLKARDVVDLAREAGVLITAAGDHVLRFIPPLVITREEISEGMDLLRGVLARLAETSSEQGAQR